MKLGPYALEQDYSQYVSRASEIVYAVVGTATKGPVDTPTICTSIPDFINKFGNLSPECFGLYAGQYFLNQSNKIYYVRAASKTSIAYATAGSDIVFEAKTPGSHLNNYTVDIKDVVVSDSDTTFTVVVKAPSEKTSADGRVLETIKNISLKSLTKTVGEESVVVPEAIHSNYMILKSVSGTVAAGTLTFSGGDDGITGITSQDYIRAGKLLVNSNIDMNLFAVPGVHDSAVIEEMLLLAQTRGDTLFLVDPPNNLDESEVKAWHNGESEDNKTRFDSSYGALYWSWQRIYDSVNGIYIEVPPSVVVAPTIARSTQVAELWYAPAGLQRGRITGVVEPVKAPDGPARDDLYTDNNVNCIITDSQVGLCIFGQKTLQRQATALDRVNVRMLLNYLKRIIVAANRTLTFEPNDRYTWNSFEDLIEPTLVNIQRHRGIYEYRIVKGEMIVTDNDIDNYRMPGMVLIRPTKAAEEIPIYFTLTSTGADFNDVLESSGINLE